MKTIAVNAYPLRESGAKSILDQFVRAAGRYSPHVRYLVFTYPGIRAADTVRNVEYVDVRQGRLAKALFRWQFSGFGRWLRTHGVRPDATVSLANVNVSSPQDGTPDFLYYHQAIPLYPERWNPLRGAQRGLWLYKTLFRRIVARSLRPSTQVFVQLECTRQRFSRVFGLPCGRIHVVAPEALPASRGPQDDTIRLDPDACNLVYPATPFVYKNHEVLLKALRILSRRNIGTKVRLYLTATREQLSPLGAEDVHDENVQVVYLGYVGQEALRGLYSRADALLFPSRIESFGLPLIEAAAMGLPVLAGDTDFAREVLRGYAGARYFPADDPQQWAGGIEELARVKGVRYSPLENREKDSWKEFFEIIHKNIDRNV